MAESETAEKETTKVTNTDQLHWLVRPRSIRWLWIGGIALLALTVLAEVWMHPHPYFGIDGTFGFNAWYGFGTCVLMVLFAKLLGLGLSRKDTYYDE